MKYIIQILAVLFSGMQAMAQTQFIPKGKIEFEKKINMYKLMGDNSWTEQIKSKMPEFRTSYSDLVFDEHQSVYKNGREVADDPWKKMWGQDMGDENVVYNNYDSSQTKTMKQVFEKMYRIEDSLTKIEWKLTSDTRKIAGFECRKAIGKMYDTLYVVAFYTDEIPTPGGPEIYAGLPGMILGIGFPRFSTTIFATKVELTTPKPAELAAPVKGKKINRTDLFSQVKTAMKDWGNDENEKQKNFWQVVL